MAAQNTLVLIHGFGVDARHFAPWLASLRAVVDVVAVDLPGFGACAAEEFPASLDALVDNLLPSLPERAMYCGWSAGGLVVTHLARRYPARVSGVLLLAANPCFVARDAVDGVWPGMAADVFDQFAAAFATDATATLRRFDKLVAMGSADMRTVARELASLRETASIDFDAARTYLQCLGAIDYRAQLPDVRQPVVALYAQDDALVPVACAQALRDMLPAAQVQVAEHAGHWLLRDNPLACDSALRALREKVIVNEQAYRRDKRDVAQAFSRAANHYEDVAHIQAQVRTALLERCDRDDVAANVLDLGCGTGASLELLQQQYPVAQVFAADLAEGMLQVARAHRADAIYMVCDAELLALGDASVERVFSSLALQWCESPQAWLRELFRVLKPGGRAHVATLADGTLHELFHAWRAVDPGHVHVNAFASVQELRVAAAGLPWSQARVDVREFCDWHASLRGVLASIRDIGAHNVNAGRARGLTGRKQLLALQQAYETFRTDAGLPVRYRVVFLELVKHE